MSINSDSRQLHVFSVRQFIPNPYPVGSFYDTLERYAELVIYRSDFPEADPSLGGSEAWCPVLMSKLVLIQKKHGWSDRETVQHAETNLQVKACLGLGVEVAGPGQATLVRHRAKMESLDLAEKYHTRFIDLLKAMELVELTGAVAVDSVPVTGAGQVLDTYNLLAASVRMGLREVCSITGERVEAVAERLGLGDYSRRSVKGAAGIAWDDAAERLQFLTQLVRDARAVQAEMVAIVTRFEKDSEPSQQKQRLNDEDAQSADPTSQVPQASEPDDPPTGGQLGFFDEPPAPPPAPPTDDVSEAELMEASARIDKIINHDIEFDDDSKVKGILQKRAGGRIISATDPDMVHGRKSASSLISGYKLQVVASVEHGFVLGTKLIAGNRHDGADLPSLVEALGQHDISPAAWIGDHAYGTIDNHLYFLDLASTEGTLVELVARNARPPNKGQYTKDEFDIDFEARTLRCPAGHVCPMTRIEKRNGHTGWRFEFSTLCTDCSHRSKCVNSKAKSETGRTVFIVEEREQFIRHHLERREQPDFKQQLATRQVVERANAGIAQCGGKKARRFGFDHVKFDCTLAALAHNFRTLGSLARRSQGLRAKLDDALARALASALFLCLRLLQLQRTQRLQQQQRTALAAAIISACVGRARSRQGVWWRLEWVF